MTQMEEYRLSKEKQHLMAETPHAVVTGMTQEQRETIQRAIGMFQTHLLVPQICLTAFLKRKNAMKKFDHFHILTCPVCGKKFIPAPLHRYKNRRSKLVCSYECVLKDRQKAKRSHRSIGAKSQLK